MDRTRKMIIVPEDRLVDVLRPTPVTTHDAVENILRNERVSPEVTIVQTPGDNLSWLDAEMYEILNSNKFTTEREKCRNYLQVLRRYLFFKENNRVEDKEASREVNEIDDVLTDESILESVPKIYARKARWLLKHWHQFDHTKLR